MKWCRRCILPDTRPNLVIGPDGVCNACAAHGSRKTIDWAAREAAFAAVVARAKRLSRGYDCIVPVSGGKDSTWQVLKCLEWGLNPLAVTWKTPARTAIGAANLDNLVRLGVDHVDYQINPKVEKRFMLEALRRFGDPAIPMHMALFAIPLALAARMQIPLVVWGENSAFEYGGSEDERQGFALDDTWLAKYGVTHGSTWRDWMSDELTSAALTPYKVPTASALAESGVLAVFLGYYFPWDPLTSLSVARDHGFRARPEGPKVGYYDYADIDDDFISVHHWLKWYKFGFTRLFDNLSLEIRNGRLSRDMALGLVRQRGDETPRDDIDQMCRFLDIEVAHFFAIAETFRNHTIWQRQPDGVWRVPDFLLHDWVWT